MKIAILGLGTVGYGVYELINKSSLDMEVVKYYDRFDLNINAKKVEDVNEIFANSEIDVVVETLGGSEFAYQCIKKALNSKKHVLTANKEVIATHLEELTNLKNKNNVFLGYEASVGGGIMIIKNLFDVATYNKIYSIEGIINGTTNFVLTKLNEGLSMEEAIKLAQEKGFAEADPSADLLGLDMVRKIAILTMIASSSKVNLQSVKHYGITNCLEIDCENAKKHGYVLKFVCSFKNGILKVEPTFLEKKDPLSLVNDEYNMIVINCENYGTLSFYGKGAGRYPTANAIYNEIVDVYYHNHNYSFQNTNDLVLENTEYGQYYLRKDNSVENNKIITSDKILISEDNYIITKYINKELINFENVLFYARIKSEV